jgi:uncharacterized repeat protein (TIGR03803 family)
MRRAVRFASLSALCCLSILFLFTVPARAASFKVIHTFQNDGNSNDGAWPQGDLVRDSAGNLYGTTASGGATDSGAVFELSPNSDGTWSESVLHSFAYDADGSSPAAGLIFDDQGNLYGTTQQGGIFTGLDCSLYSGCGVVFELSPSASGWSYTVLQRFSGPDGAGSTGKLVFDANGNLYGTTIGGGIGDGSICYGGCGVAFELIRAHSWREKVLHKFLNEGYNDGGNPSGAMVFDGDGNLYGTTVSGGSIGSRGTVYKLTPAAKGPWTETILYSFCSLYCADGSEPTGGPVLQNGGIYGATFNNGTKSAGTVFKLVDSANGWQVREFSFDGTDGQGPIAPVLLVGKKIFGVTQQGGIVNGACFPFQYGNGVVYELAPENGLLHERVLHRFTGGADGCRPSAALISDPKGNLFGTAFEGGASSDAGVVFEITR